MPELPRNVKIILWQPRLPLSFMCHPWREMGCIRRAQPLYCARMAEQEDLNAFGYEDSAGAVLTLGIVPVVGCYIFFRDMVGLMVFFGVLAVALAAFVYLLGRLTGWRIIGTVVNLAGCILVPLYIAVAIWLWMSPYAPTARFNKDKPAPTPAAQPGAPVPAAPPAN